MSYFKAKMHKIRFRMWLRPRPRWGSLQRSPDTLAGLKGPTSKGKEGRGREIQRTRLWPTDILPIFQKYFFYKIHSTFRVILLSANKQTKKTNQPTNERAVARGKTVIKVTRPREARRQCV